MYLRVCAWVYARVRAHDHNSNNKGKRREHLRSRFQANVSLGSNKRIKIQKKKKKAGEGKRPRKEVKRQVCPWRKELTVFFTRVSADSQVGSTSSPPSRFWRVRSSGLRPSPQYSLPSVPLISPKPESFGLVQTRATERN